MDNIRRHAKRVPEQIRTAEFAKLPTSRELHTIPPELLSRLNLRKNLLDHYPCLLETPTIANYAERTKLLLYMEEFAARVSGQIIPQEPAIQLKPDPAGQPYVYWFPGYKGLRNGERIIVECVEEKTIFDAEIVKAGSGVNTIRVNVPNQAIFDVTAQRYNVRRLPARDWFRHLHTALHIMKSDLSVQLIFGSRSGRIDTRRQVEFFDEDLDGIQREAVRQVVHGGPLKCPYIIMGSPGTGKTRTLNELILQLTKLSWTRVLISGATFRSTCRLAEAYQSTENCPNNSFSLLVRNKVCLDQVSRAVKDHVCMVETLQSGLNERVVFSVVHDTPEITENCGGGHWSKFTHLIVDDCAGLTEPDSLLPIACLIPRDDVGIILSGDVMGMAPAVRSPEAAKFGLKNSLLFRLIDSPPWTTSRQQKDGVFITELTKNYRSVAGIASVIGPLLNNYESNHSGRPNSGSSENNGMNSEKSSKSPGPSAGTAINGGDRSQATSRFSGRKVPSLISGVVKSPASEANKDRLCELVGLPSLQVITVEGTETTFEDLYANHLKWNPAEVQSVVDSLKRIYEFGVDPADICVFTPYPGQVQKITDALKADHVPAPTIPSSVYHMVGQEWDVVLVSCVQTGPAFGQLTKDGFIDQPELTNFVFSRAKRHLVVIGDCDRFFGRDDYLEGFLMTARRLSRISRKL